MTQHDSSMTDNGAPGVSAESASGSAGSTPANGSSGLASGEPGAFACGASGAVFGRVSHIQRASVSDGPGVRTTVFLSGCPLICPWCHNPETRGAGRPVLLFYKDRCTGCGACAAVCEEGARSVCDIQRGPERPRCAACGACVPVCPSDALAMRGTVMDAETVMAVVTRDKPFYDSTGGGLTVSGGEPLYQFEFTRALLASARKAGVHTCLDTSGWGGRAVELSPLIDLFLWDIKETDPARHLKYTGVELSAIIDSLRAVDKAGGAIRLRCPIIPGINDRTDHLYAVGNLVNRLKNVVGVDLVEYHNLGESKQSAMGDTPSRFGRLPDDTKNNLLTVLTSALTHTIDVPARWHI